MMGDKLAKSIKYTGNLPVSDSDISFLGQTTAARWKNNPGLTLAWITPAEHEANVQAFVSSYNERLIAGGRRREISQKIAALDGNINEGISNIKNYLVYRYGKRAARSYYPQFGVEYNGYAYIVPRDRDKRVAVLPMIIQAVAAHGFTGEKYGLQFWQTTAAGYRELMQQLGESDGHVSVKVGEKNQLRRVISRTHVALINLLKANYPDTYAMQMRNWGFQKEKY